MSLPQTEITPKPEDCIDAMPPLNAVSALLGGQVAAVQSVTAALPQLIDAARLMAATVRAGGRLIYVAAGSSGLMALADGSELPGTFGVSQDQIRIFMAGGVPVDGKMPGDTEDDTTEANRIIDALSANDLVLVLSASGTTPYPCEIARRARIKGIRVVAIANNPDTPLLRDADVAVYLPTPPEVLAGSTRLGAGTAQKVALNIASTFAGVLLGHVHDGMMVNLLADNTKLRGRARGMVARIANVTSEVAETALVAAAGHTKLAVLLAKGCSIAKAKQLLTDNDGNLGRCLETLAPK